MWSGGLDSTWQLLWVLKNTDSKIHAHHIHLVNGEGRTEAERQAVMGAKSELEKIRQFGFSESVVDDRQLSWVPADMATVMLQAGKKIKEAHKMAEFTPFTHFTIGTCLEEGHNWTRWVDMMNILKAVLWDATEVIPVPEFILPIMVAKAQEVIDLGDVPYWSCRRPVKEGEGFNRCGVCKPCSDMVK